MRKIFYDPFLATIINYKNRWSLFGELRPQIPTVTRGFYVLDEIILCKKGSFRYLIEIKTGNVKTFIPN